MKKLIKSFLRIVLEFCMTGLVVGIVGLIDLKYDLTKLSELNYEDNAYYGWDIDEEFDHIVIETKTADIQVGSHSLSDNTVECREEARLKHRVKVQDGTLFITVEDTRKWYDKLIEPREDARVLVWVPFSKMEYKTLEMKSETGDVTVGMGLQFDKVTVETGTGDVLVVSKVLDELKVKTTTGTINVSDINHTIWNSEENHSVP